MQYTQEIRLDVSGESIYRYVNAKQYDNATRYIKATLVSGGKRLLIEDGITARFRFLKPDGHSGINPATINEDGTITMELTDQVLAVPGTVKADICLCGSEDKVLSTVTYMIQVEAAPVGKEIVSSNEFLELVQMIEKGNSLIESLEKASFRVSGGYIQASTDGKTWKNLVAVADLKGPKGDPGGADGLTVQGNMLYLTIEGEILPAGIELPESSSGVSFDGGYVSEDGYLHFTLGDEELEGYDPVYIGSAGGSGGGTGAIMKLINTMGKTTVAVAAGQSCTVTYKWSSVDDTDKAPTGDGAAVYSMNGKQIGTATVEQGEQSYVIPAEIINEGNNTFSVMVTDAYGTEKVLNWTLVSKAISLNCSLDDTTIYNEDVLIRYTPIGSDIAKTTTFELDGNELATATTADTNIVKSYILPMQSHGAHTLRMWTSATIGGVSVQSAVLTYHLIFVENGNNTPIISIKNYTAPRQYSTTAIPYMVYDPMNQNAAVILSEDGDSVASLSVDRGLQTWLYKPTVTGAHTLTISCGVITASVNLIVADSGVDVSEITDGLLWSFDPSGRSNTEANRDQWSDGDVSMTVSDGFHWSHGGWGADEDGYPCFTVPAGDTITISAKPFTSDWKRNGHLLKMVFKAVNVRDYNAQVMSCMSGNIGMVVQAQGATIKSEQTQLNIPLCEERYTELEFNITSSTHHREILATLQGVLSGAKVYADNDSFIQADPVPITIGSQDCDVRIYRMREYNAYLTDEELFANWIADAPSGEEMLNRWQRNQITDDYGNIDPDKLADVAGDLRVQTLTCTRFTTGKKDTVSGGTLRQVYKNGGAKHCFTAPNVDHQGQGTTSDGYGDSGRNTDFSYAGGFDFDDGTHADTYAMTEDSIPVNYLNNKVNVASSENANNAMLTRWYQRFNPHKRAARLADSRVRDTMEFHPSALFVQDMSGVLFGDTKVHFYAAGDIGNSKKNYEAQGLGGNPDECIVEFLNNTSDVCRWRSDDLSAETWDGDGDLEFRYPKNPTQSMKDAFHRVLSWVVSTITENATNAPLSSAVTYNGTVYRADSAEYRQSKFVNEFDDYFIADSILYFYLFTERRSMVDNRAKNTFWHSEDLIHWDLDFDYDNDTACGNDNEGGLTLPYGKEDTDTIGTKSVFNASDSTLFCNVRDFLHSRLVTMFQTLETAGAWKADAYLAEVKAYQSVKPERLWNADMRRKYLRPYEDNGIVSYLPMLHGTKELQRAQFEIYQEKYMASKYISASCMEDIITLRGYTPTDYGDGVAPSGDIDITMYQDCYVVVKYGSNNMKYRAKQGETIHVKCPIPKMNDTEIYICTASRVQKIGSLAALYVGYCNFGAARKLQSLVISPVAPGYTNTNIHDINLGNCQLLQSLTICCCPELTAALSFAGCPSLEDIDLRGTGVSGVTFADGGYLETALLPGSITSISGKRLDSLETLALEGYDALRTLHLEYCSTVDSLSLVTNATKLTRVRLLGINWISENAEALVRISSVGGIDDSGYDTQTAVVTGTTHIGALSLTKLNKLYGAFPDLEIIFDSLSAEHTLQFVNADTLEVYDTQLVEHGYGGSNPITRAENPIETPTQESTPYFNYHFAGWSGSFSTIIQDTVIYAVFREETRTYTVTWYNGFMQVKRLQVDAGGGAKYTGSDLQKTGYIWTGWDKMVQNVLEDLDVYATFEEPALPAEKVDTSLYDFVYSDDLNDNFAYTFGEFIGIITSGLASEYFGMYDRIKIINTWTGIKDESFVLSLHSLGHYMLEDRSGLAETTWFMVGVLNANRQWNPTNTNVGGYLGCGLDTWLENSFYPNLPCYWRAVVNPVMILANAGDQSTTIKEEARHCYPPAYCELVYGLSEIPYKNEVCAEANEKQFSIYTGNSQRIKKTFNGEGTAQNYWTRTAHSGSSSSVCYVTSTGGNNTTPNVSGSYAVCVGLSISKINQSAA